MAPSHPKPSRWFTTLLWGNSIALSWMWGLGLFFSVQFTTQFGLFGLLTFAIPNALGLLAFGLVTHHIARREAGSESLARFFKSWSRPFRLVFFLYQLLAITLTIFAFIRYVWQPLGFQPWALYLPLTLLIVLAASVLLGEEFDITRIRYSHGVMALILLVAVCWLLLTAISVGPGKVTFPRLPTNDLAYWGYAIPICIGFLVGPWLDLQQWQRAIQMHRERISIAAAYWAGSTQFFVMLLFHGCLALWALNWAAGSYLRTGIANYVYGHELLLRLFYERFSAWTFAAYVVWLVICILSTLDSGYIALRWFLQANAAASKSPIFSLIPENVIASPIPVFIFAGLFALFASVVKLELEYFMIFYATFFVGYSALAITRCYMNTPANVIPQVKMFCIGCLAVVIFAYGYFLRLPLLQILGSLLPLALVIWLIFKPGSSQEFIGDSRALSPVSEIPMPPEEEEASESFATTRKKAMRQRAEARAQELGVTAAPSSEQDGGAIIRGHDLSGHFEGKWFVHSFIATYADTNSVGNVYFGMYAMWVGKTRELFFNKVLPRFNIKETPFYILTRSFEHKFVRETREFEKVTVRLRISDWNRKFVTLEHEVKDSAEQLLGRGKQTLLFVSSSDYSMIDLPADIAAAFVNYA
jgi:acyl-CoA thioesterase FadM